MPISRQSQEDMGGAWEYDDLKFSGAKLYWLIHDIVINGLSYKPQGFIKEMTKIIYVSPVLIGIWLVI